MFFATLFAGYTDGAAVSGARARNSRYGVGADTADSTVYFGLVPHRFAYLMDLIVRPEQRNQGVATALLDAVKQWGAANKLDYVELQVLLEMIKRNVCI